MKKTETMAITITITRDDTRTRTETSIDAIQVYTHAGTATLNTHQFIAWLNRISE